MTKVQGLIPQCEKINGYVWQFKVLDRFLIVVTSLCMIASLAVYVSSGCNQQTERWRGTWGQICVVTMSPQLKKANYSLLTPNRVVDLTWEQQYGITGWDYHLYVQGIHLNTPFQAVIVVTLLVCEYIFRVWLGIDLPRGWLFESRLGAVWI